MTFDMLTIGLTSVSRVSKVGGRTGGDERCDVESVKGILRGDAEGDRADLVDGEGLIV